jgi:hypothetical protein
MLLTYVQIYDSLDSETVYVVADWKMKLLEMKHRQAMTEFFGQRGIGWFGAMFYRKKTAGEKARDVSNKTPSASAYDTRFIDLTMSDSKEDAFAAISMLELALRHYKLMNPQVKKFILKTDGAGCFSGAELFRFLPSAEALTGLRCEVHFVSEAGCGKSPLDSHFCYGRKVLIRLAQCIYIDCVCIVYISTFSVIYYGYTGMGYGV